MNPSSGFPTDVFGASNVSKAASPFFQQSSPSATIGFGYGGPSVTPLFGGQSSSFHGSGSSGSTGTLFGGQNWVSPGFAVTAPSANPFLGGQSSSSSGIGSSFGTSHFGGPSSSSPVFGVVPQQSSSSFWFGEAGAPAMTGNSHEGTRIAPYRPTLDTSDHKPGSVITSIAAMNAYCNKSHEELRSEDYKQPRPKAAGFPGVSMSFPNVFQSNTPNPHSTIQSGNSGFRSPAGGIQTLPYTPLDNVPAVAIQNLPYTTSDNVPAVAVQNLPKTTGLFTVPPSSEFVRNAGCCGTSEHHYKNRTSTAQTTVAQTGIAPNTTNNQTLNLNGEASSIGPLGWTSFVQAFANCGVPALGHNGASSGGLLRNPALGSNVSVLPVFVPATFGFMIPQYPQVSDPPGAPAWESHMIPRMMPLVGVQSNDTTRVNGLNGGHPISAHVASSSGVPAEQISNPITFAPSAPTITTKAFDPSPMTQLPSSNLSQPTSSSATFFPKMPTFGFGPIDQSLEVIVQNLGPLMLGDAVIHEYLKGKKGIPCEDASNDADIIALAEFAVEQHNAMDKDGKVEFVKVNVACLEAVDGGRYHIVLEGKMTGSVPIRRFYASVLRKKTDRPNQLIVLEKWICGRVEVQAVNPSAYPF